MPTGFPLVRLFALVLPAALMAGALGSQYIGGLYPCEMCHWQRWPHYAAIVLAAIGFVAPAPAGRVAVALAAMAIATSGAIGVFHAGVEYGWWEGITACTSTVGGQGGTAEEMLARIMNAPVIRCDVAQWEFMGISLAGFNAIFSIAGAATILGLMWRSK